MSTSWKKAARCEAGSCVEVRFVTSGLETGVEVRDSKNPAHPSLRFTRDEWDTFVAAAKEGEFDL